MLARPSHSWIRRIGSPGIDVADQQFPARTARVAELLDLGGGPLEGPAQEVQPALDRVKCLTLLVGRRPVLDLLVRCVEQPPVLLRSLQPHRLFKSGWSVVSNRRDRTAT